MDDSTWERISGELSYEIHESDSEYIDFYIDFHGDPMNFRYVDIDSDRLEDCINYGRYGLHRGRYFWANEDDMAATRSSSTSPVIFIFDAHEDGLYYLPFPKKYQHEEENSGAIIIDGEITLPPLSQFPEVLDGQEIVDHLDAQFDRSIPSRIANKFLGLIGFDTREIMPGVDPDEDE